MLVPYVSHAAGGCAARASYPFFEYRRFDERLDGTEYTSHAAGWLG